MFRGLLFFHNLHVVVDSVNIQLPGLVLSFSFFNF